MRTRVLSGLGMAPGVGAKAVDTAIESLEKSADPAKREKGRTLREAADKYTLIK